MTEMLALYRKSAFIRAFELQLAVAADAGHVPGLLHLCCGAELLEVAFCSYLSGPKDQVTGSHRSHGLALAMGVNPVALAAEIMGRAAGLSAGRGGTQHLMAPEKGFLTSNGIVGAQVPIAAGAALTAKMMNAGGVACTFFGDGAANQGGVFETMNLAVVQGLPLIFVMENNGLGQSTAASYASGATSLLKRAEGFGLKGWSVDGFDGADCLRKAAEVIDFVRSGKGPAFVEAKVPRLTGHYYGEKAVYLAHHETRDPLKELEHALDPKTADKIYSEAEEAAHRAIVEAVKLPEAGREARP